jgi:hypothetical protein
MEESAIQFVKHIFMRATGLSKDALHVYIGLAILIAAAMVLRKRLSSILPWLVVFAIACIGELLDMRDDLASMGYWRWRASVHDLLNTLFWPTVLMLIVRYGTIFQPECRRGS